MPKNTAYDEHRKTKSHVSPSLTRKPIRPQVEKEDGSDEKTDPDSPKKLYPLNDLEEDLLEIRKQPVRNNSERPQKEQPPEQAPDEEAGKSSDFCNLKKILYILLSVVAVLFGFMYHTYQPDKPSAGRTIDLPQFISDMENKFVGQDPQTFRILKTSLKKVVSENSKPAAPSIITIITNKGAEITASLFSNYIVRELAPEHYVSINESTFHSNADNLKYDIDAKIKFKFDNRSLNAVVVDRFHNIPIAAAMIFHNYCDHENAPFKRAIFLFIVHLDLKIPENSSLRDKDAAAMKALRSIWSDASDDIVDSLITRLTVSVINIK